MSVLETNKQRIQQLLGRKLRLILSDGRVVEGDLQVFQTIVLKGYIITVSLYKPFISAWTKI